MSKILVKTHPETGRVLTQNPKNQDWSTVRLEQETFVMNGRIAGKVTRSAFITGPTEVLNAMNLQPNGEYPVPGKLVVKESLTPFYEGQKAKVAGDTGVECKLDGQPIYRQVEFSNDTTAPDVLIAHNNTEEIRAVQAVQTAAAQVTPVG